MKRKKSSHPTQNHEEREKRRPCHTLEIETRDIVEEVEVADVVERDLVCGVY